LEKKDCNTAIRVFVISPGSRRWTSYFVKGVDLISFSAKHIGCPKLELSSRIIETNPSKNKRLCALFLLKEDYRGGEPKEDNPLGTTIVYNSSSERGIHVGYSVSNDNELGESMIEDLASIRKQRRFYIPNIVVGNVVIFCEVKSDNGEWITEDVTKDYILSLKHKFSQAQNQ